MSRRILTAIITLLVIALLIGTAFLLVHLIFPENRIVSPKIEPVVPTGLPIPVSSTYPFQNGTVTITVSANRSVYEGAKNAEKSVTIIGNITESVWIAESYRAMIDDPAQEPLYRELLTGFRAIRQEENLDSDEYLELIAVYVQSLQYETTGKNPAKFPIETVVDHSGDCDDKSLLLAGLLSREGYAVALLTFGEENHMAVGIGAEDCRYRDTMFTFLETTNVSFVGIAPNNLVSDLPLRSAPFIIPVGEGTTNYTACTETRYIHEMLAESEQQANKLQSRLLAMEGELNDSREEIRAMEKQLQDLKIWGDFRNYNAGVATYNARISSHNDLLRMYRQNSSRYESYVSIHNYIISHEFDRKGVYQFTRTNMPAY